MPVEETHVLNIVCDNPNCPGNDLDPAVRTGWIFVSHEVYGQPTASSVFCSSECVSAAALLATADPGNAFPPIEGIPGEPIEIPPGEVEVIPG